jgi:hypothetical protein
MESWSTATVGLKYLHQGSLQVEDEYFDMVNMSQYTVADLRDQPGLCLAFTFNTRNGKFQIKHMWFDSD